MNKGRGCACKQEIFFDFVKSRLVQNVFAYSVLIYSAAKVTVDWAETAAAGGAEGHHSSAKRPLKNITLMIPFLTPDQSQREPNESKRTFFDPDSLIGERC